MSDWKEALGTTSDEVWDRQETLQGIYIERQENVGPNNSMMYLVKTDKLTVSVWGSTILDARFAEIPIGSEVKIEPLGETKSEKTGRSYMNFKVMYRSAPFEEAGAKPGLDRSVLTKKAVTPKTSDLPEDEVNLDDIPF